MTKRDPERNEFPDAIDKEQEALYGEGQDPNAVQQEPTPTVTKLHPTSNDVGEQTKTKHGHPGERESLRTGDELDTSDEATDETDDELGDADEPVV